MDIRAHITGTVWKVLVRPGQTVAEGDVLLILESMKMEMPLESPSAGTVIEIRCNEGDSVNEDEVLAVLQLAKA